MNQAKSLDFRCQVIGTPAVCENVRSIALVGDHCLLASQSGICEVGVKARFWHKVIEQDCFLALHKSTLFVYHVNARKVTWYSYPDWEKKGSLEIPDEPRWADAIRVHPTTGKLWLLCGLHFVILDHENHRLQVMRHYGEVVAFQDGSVVILNQTRQVVEHIQINMPRPCEISTMDSNPRGFLLHDSKQNQVLIVHMRQCAAISLFLAMHARVGGSSPLFQLSKRSTMFDRQVLRVPLRLAGALFNLVSKKRKRELE